MLLISRQFFYLYLQLFTYEKHWQTELPRLQYRGVGRVQISICPSITLQTHEVTIKLY